MSGPYLSPALPRRPRSSSGSSTAATAQRFIAATFGSRSRPSTSDGHSSMSHHVNSIHKYANGSSAHPSSQAHPFQDLNSGAAVPSSALLITDDGDEGPECPICVEPLSHRLQGEKAHVTPVCGHQLHHECFRQVYGDVTQARLRKASLGLCGICRSDMRLDESGDCGPVRKNKFAALTGTGPLGGDTDSMLSSALGSRRSEHGQEDDDLVQIPLGGELETPSHSARISQGTTSSSGTLLGRRDSSTTAKPASSISGRSPRGFHLGQDIIQPVISVRAEHPAIVRGGREDSDKHHLTCMVTIEMPSRWPTPDPRSVYLPPRPFEEGPPLHTRNGSGLYAQPHGDASHSRSNSGQSWMGPPERALSSPPSSIHSAFAFASTTATNTEHDNHEMNEQVQDLKTRMTDWKGHSLDEFGALKLFNLISVRKDANTRDFLVYLFSEAILFVNEEHRRGLAHKIVDGLSGQGDRLRLKGRVYVRHIDSVIDTSSMTTYSLTVIMSDDALDEFVLTFRDRMTLERWQKYLTSLINRHKLPISPNYHLQSVPPPAPSSGARSRAMVNSSSNESNSSTGGSAESWGTGGYRSSSSSGFTRTGGTAPSTVGSCMIPEEGSTSPRPRIRAQSSDYPSNISVAALSLAGPREFTSLDLMLILSVPLSGPNHLKIGILRNTLDFIIQNVGPRTRIAVVTFSAGDGARGLLRKTPFLAVGKQEGRKRLDAVVAELGKGRGECEALVEHQEDRVNVVTACNVAIDITLQRKVKSALTGMILMNDGKDGAQKQHMDLVMARAEATAVPIHTIGWGRSHDPSSLWLLSNHTGGSYTFVKDFYELRETMAGCVGGILSIAATNVRLHISVPETRWLRIRKASGAPNAIVSSAGTDVDVDIGELRFSERKELLIEIEMSFSGFESGREPAATGKPPPRTEANNATDAFFLQNVGMNPSVLETYESNNSSEGDYESMPDEIALFEVNAAYRDPAAGICLSRLHSPTVLTVAIVNSDGTPSARLTSTSSDPEIIRRRMELLTSDMLSRALLLVTRKNEVQARRLLEETKRIISTISGTLVNSSAPLAPGSPGFCAAALPTGLSAKQRRSWIAATCFAETTLAACAEDVSRVLDGCAEGSDAFTQHVRYVAAQSTVVLRDQRAFTNQSATERLFFSADHAVWLAARSREWVSCSY
ncbi:BQ5605_C002g01220 [Microbotryum silenes-dioicae]|uniref:BQ5605_C002g01220 protein n=1 Tax=Microbotryum silenes-dioicae TaxID=796604 RepID=A0A2X0M2N7_9BASI|nr:BQ5605_C002g01220 [Microbotryum silenes-dioicae]